MKMKRIFNQILKPYKAIIKELEGNYTNIKVTIGKTFCCFCRDVEDLEINVPLLEDKMGAKAFYNKMINKLQENGIEEIYSSEILSFLHELGHIYTYNKFNDFTYCKMATLITKVQNVDIIANNKKLTNWLYKCYFNLALERNADKWAINYIKKNPETVRRWEKSIANNYVKYQPKLEKAIDELCKLA